MKNELTRPEVKFEPVEMKKETESLFDAVVSRSYLSVISEAQPVSYKENIENKTSLEIDILKSQGVIPDAKKIRQRIANAHQDVTWYKITKIVKEKDVFFTDKLSMLYAALQHTAGLVAMALNKRAGGQIDLLIGTRDKYGMGADYVASRILESGMKGFLPGVRFERAEENLLDTLYSEESVGIACVSGVASLRDDKKEHFVQGIERLINSTNDIKQFTVLFLAESLNEAEVLEIQHSLENIYSAISPMAQTQLTYSYADAITVNKSISKSISESVSKNTSKTITNGESSTRTSGKTIGQAHSGGGNAGILIAGVNYSYSTNKSFSESVADGINKSKAETVGDSISHGMNIGVQDSSGTQETNTVGNQITINNRHVKSCMDIIDKQIERIRDSKPFGLWGVATYFIAKYTTHAEMLAGIYRGTIVGDQSGKETVSINSWGKGSPESNTILEFLRKGEHPLFNLGNDLRFIKPCSIVNSKELAIHMSLPQSSVPGVLVREEETFGRNVISQKPLTEDNSLRLGMISHLGEVSQSEEVRLGIDGLSKHLFVTGTTGSGKSNTLYLVLEALMNKGCTCMVIEPAKGEYKNVFGNRKDVTVYGNNPKISSLLRINPFAFPEDIHVYEHIDQLVEIFNACWPMYAAMPQVLKHSIEQAYKDCGWDLINSVNRKNIVPTVEDVLEALRNYINESEYSNDTKGDYKGSLETRLQSLCDGITGQMFSGTPISDEDLFNRNVIVDLSRVKSSETKSLLMGLLVMKLNEFRMSENKGMNLPLRHVTVLEEAHNLLKRTSTQQSSEGSNLAGMAVEKISNSIAEMRTYGEGFVIADQSPSMLDTAAIRNTNTKIIMALPEKDDREMAGKAIGLTDKQIEEISKLKTGEAITYQNGWEVAVKCQIDRYNQEEILWQNQPEEIEYSENHKDRLLSNVLYRTYAGDGDVELDEMRYAILDSKLTGARKAKAMDVLEGLTELKPDDCALLLAAMVGNGLFAHVSKSVENVSDMNEALAESLEKLPMIDEMFIDTYVNMYVRGCSLGNKSDFYDNWLMATAQSLM